MRYRIHTLHSQSPSYVFQLHTFHLLPNRLILRIRQVSFKMLNIFNWFCPKNPNVNGTFVNKARKNTDIGNEKKRDFFCRNYDRPTEETVGLVQGKIPEWLEGTLIRNGPGIIKIGDDTYNHLFDGLAVLHRYHIQDGRVTYTGRALESDTYKKNMQANRIVVSEFGTTAFPDPCKTIFQRFQTKFKSLQGKHLSDSCSVSVGYYGDQLYAMTETNALRRIDPKDLSTIGDKTVLTDFVAINKATAHPHVCEDGTVYNMGNNFRHKSGPHYVVAKIPPTFGSSETCFNEVEIIAEIPMSSFRYPSYYHSFAITKGKLVFIESPWRLDLLKLLKTVWTNETLDTALVWKPELKSRFYVVSLLDGKIHPVVYESDAFFAFHHINAYEEEGQIVVDVACYDRIDVFMAVTSGKTGDKPNEDFSASPRRFVLPLQVEDASENTNLITLKHSKAQAFLNGTSEGKPRVVCIPQNLNEDWMELPRINYRYNGKKYNYFYGGSSFKHSTWTSLDMDSITKVDIQNNTCIRWFEENYGPTEPVFVANPNSKSQEEDDGVILTALMDRKQERKTTLLVLDAKNMTEIARVDFNTASPFTTTFHGQWANLNDKTHLF